MKCHAPRMLSILLGVAALIFSVGGAPEMARACDEEELELEVSELDTVKDWICKLDLKEAEDAFKQAKAELKPRKREKGVKAAIEVVKVQLSALREYEKAKQYVDKRKYPKALKCMSKVLRAYGEIWFADEAESLYSGVKQRIYYVINDFENEEFRDPENFDASLSGGRAEVIRDARFSSDGRHALKVHFDARGDGVHSRDLAAYRAVALRTPLDFPRKIEAYRAVTFSVYSHKKVYDLISVDIMGDVVGTTATSSAKHPGISLKFVGRQQQTLLLNRFNFRGGFQWSDASNIQFSTRGPGAVDVTIDDVKLVREGWSCQGPRSPGAPLPSTDSAADPDAP